LHAFKKKTGEKDALGRNASVLKWYASGSVAFEFSFLGGSMGPLLVSVCSSSSQMFVGKRIPLICFSVLVALVMQSSALFSLMQWQKPVLVYERMKQKGIPYHSVMTDPVFGGVFCLFSDAGEI